MLVAGQVSRSHSLGIGTLADEKVQQSSLSLGRGIAKGAALALVGKINPGTAGKK
jgi:hypothetical protein